MSEWGTQSHRVNHPGSAIVGRFAGGTVCTGPASLLDRWSGTSGGGRAVITVAASLLEAELSCLHTAEERLPLVWSERQYRPALVFRVAHSDMPVDERDLHAAIASAARTLPPCSAGKVHFDPSPPARRSRRARRRLWCVKPPRSARILSQNARQSVIGPVRCGRTLRPGPRSETDRKRTPLKYI